MKRLRIVNRQRQTLATVEWSPPGVLRLNVLHAGLGAELNALVDSAKTRGLPSHRAREADSDGHRVLVDEVVTLSPTDEQFLGALADWVNGHSLGGDRAFGVLEPDDTSREVQS